jgi:hypothetical protein
VRWRYFQADELNTALLRNWKLLDEDVNIREV